MSQNETNRITRAGRWLLAFLGFVCVGLGALGAVLPGLPTTIFLLMASYLFARSCPALERKLLEHPRLGPYLQQARGRRMPRRAKLSTLALMWTGIGISCWLTRDGNVLPFVVLACGLIGTAVVLFYIRSAEPAADSHRA